MADPLDPFALNILGVGDLVSNPVNKVNAGQDGPEGPTGDREDALTFNASDDKLIELADLYETKYASYEVMHKRIVESNLESYLGKKKNGQWLAGDQPLAANIQFEAEETFLAATLAKNPEPVVYADNTPEGNAIANAVKTMLAYHADRLVIRRKLSLMVRQWSIHHLGVMKVGWNKVVNDVTVENRKIQNFIFDPEGYVDAYGDFIGYMGERFETTAEILADQFPSEKTYIYESVENKLGTKVTYTEWWSPDGSFSFLKYKRRILDKFKNPYFRYPEDQLDFEGNPMMGEEGAPVTVTPRNHFAIPKKPFIFLSVYSLQERPHDITGLIEQNIANQNIINRRTDQIDYNVSAANNTFALSEDNFDQETAKQFSTGRRRGNPLLIPSGGPIDAAVKELNAPSLPADVFNQLEISKNDLRTSWGIQGISAQPEDEDQTARGMILNQAHDTSRIGGGIGDALEQVADNIFNWLTQLYYVFYDEQHWAAVMGNAKAVEYVILSNQDLDRQLIVSVAPDSLKPKDDITNMNLAQDLFEKGAIGPKILLKMLDFPDPDNAAADGVLYRTDPMAYLQMNWPDLAQQMMQAQQQKAMLDAVSQANATGMNTAAEAANTPPEQVTEPTGGLSEPPASASLGQVPLPQLPR